MSNHTIQEIATAAGVDKSTVSRVLSGKVAKGRMGLVTQERIRLPRNATMPTTILSNVCPVVERIGRFPFQVSGRPQRVDYSDQFSA